MENENKILKINQYERIVVGELIFKGGNVSIMMTSSYSRDWFDYAIHEAKAGSKPHSLRKEILFAVCFAETYLFEWIRDDVLKGDYEKLIKYFPSGEKRGVKDKWKDIPKQLYKDGLIAALPDNSGVERKSFMDLIAMRDGLVHARTSRPEKTLQPEEEKPFPRQQDLEKYSPGEPTKVVISLIKKLHQDIGTSVPNWMNEPS
jgi:hypothetical protein